MKFKRKVPFFRFDNEETKDQVFKVFTCWIKNMDFSLKKALKAFEVIQNDMDFEGNYNFHFKALMEASTDETKDKFKKAKQAQMDMMRNSLEAFSDQKLKELTKHDPSKVFDRNQLISELTKIAEDLNGNSSTVNNIAVECLDASVLTHTKIFILPRNFPLESCEEKLSTLLKGNFINNEFNLFLYKRFMVWFGKERKYRSSA